MSGSSSEAKTEKGTEQKLRKERKRGRALTAPVTVKAIAAVAILLAVVAMTRRTALDFSLLFDTTMEAGGKPDIDRVRDVWTIFGRVVSGAALVLLGLASSMAILANTVIKKGFVFSAENLSPKFERLNPATNLKNMFAKRALIEFGVGLLEVSLWLIAAVLLIRGYTPALITAFSLDVPTVLRLFVLIFVSFIVLAIIFLILTAGVDLPVQRFLFAQDMRMTKSEVRRENKDSHGDPKLVAERRRQAKASLEKKIGIRNSSFIAIGSQGAVGLHYIMEETDYPILTLRINQSDVSALAANARRLGIPIVKNDELVSKLASGVDIGDELSNEEIMQPFTDAFVASVTQ